MKYEEANIWFFSVIDFSREFSLFLRLRTTGDVTKSRYSDETSHDDDKLPLSAIKHLFLFGPVVTDVDVVSFQTLLIN